MTLNEIIKSYNDIQKIYHDEYDIAETMGDSLWIAREALMICKYLCDYNGVNSVELNKIKMDMEKK